MRRPFSRTFFFSFAASQRISIHYNIIFRKFCPPETGTVTATTGGNVRDRLYIFFPHFGHSVHAFLPTEQLFLNCRSFFFPLWWVCPGLSRWLADPLMTLIQSACVTGNTKTGARDRTASSKWVSPFTITPARIVDASPSLLLEEKNNISL